MSATLEPGAVVAPAQAAGRSRVRELVSLLLVWCVTGAWVWARLDQGWIPHDDGAFAQSAARVLDGELPHRDFVELYTGGLTF